MGRASDFGTDNLFSMPRRETNSVIDRLSEMNVDMVEKQIPIEQISSFPNHPFRVDVDDSMLQLVASIKAKGLLEPVLVRKKGHQSYEMLSGHRRMKACEIAGIKELKAIVIDVDDDEAVGVMVDSNLHRPNILPSEKAFAYKMKMDAMKHQGKRADLIGSEIVESNNIVACQNAADIKDVNEDKIVSAASSSAEEIGKEARESARQVFRYLRLTNLSKPLLKAVDEKKLKLVPAVNLSYIPEETQNKLYDVFEETGKYPSNSQSTEIRSMSESDEDVDVNDIREILNAPKKETVKLPKRVMELIPKGEDPAEYIYQAINFFQNPEVI